jgi:endonuclease/exonuclease/phosphatase family metal-dependent hydrolase
VFPGAVALATSATACAGGRNYVDPAGPRFARPTTITGTTPSLRVVTFNLEYGQRVNETVALFRQSRELQSADVVVMQEMNERAVQQLADSLQMGYVYYPATRHPKFDLNFGNAILSRWPIEDDNKLVLPRLARLRKTQRIAVSGTIRLAGEPVRIFAVHLATVFDNGPAAQREQIRAILDAAKDYDRVIVAGDMNGRDLAGTEFERSGYTWATRNVGPTMLLWRVDHVFIRGLSLAKQNAVGVVRDNHRASDHRPVWAVVE